MDISRTKIFIVDCNYSRRIATSNEFMHRVKAVFTKGLKHSFAKHHKIDILIDQFPQDSLLIKDKTMKT